MVWPWRATVVPVRVPSETTSLVGAPRRCRPRLRRLLALLRWRGGLPRGAAADAVGVAPRRAALRDARSEQVAADDLDGHDHEQPQYGEETQPHDRQGQL